MTSRPAPAVQQHDDGRNAQILGNACSLAYEHLCAKNQEHKANYEAEDEHGSHGLQSIILWCIG